MEYRILGPLEAGTPGRVLNPGGLRQRRLLAALLLNPNRAIPISTLVEAIWGEDAPAAADRQVRNRIAALRTLLTPAGGYVDTVADFGYRLRVGDGELDAAVFEELARSGRAARDPALLRQALATWRGPALDGLTGSWLRREAD